MKFGDQMAELDLYLIGSVVTEANKVLQHELKEGIGPYWIDIEDEIEQSILNGIKTHLAYVERTGNALTPKESHELWIREKDRLGWKYGPVKDVKLKEHPCFVSYLTLSKEQRLKDYLFSKLIEAFYLWNKEND